MSNIINWVKRPSIAKKLILSFLLILTVPIIVLSYSAYQTASSTLDGEIMDNARENVNQLNEIINQNISQKTNAMSYFSGFIKENSFKGKESDALKVKFEQFAKLHPDVEGIFTGSKDGKFIRYPDQEMPSGYNPVERDWYKKAAEHKGEVIITDPYKTASTGTMVITIAKMHEDGSGVVAVNMKIEELIKATERVTIGKKALPLSPALIKSLSPTRNMMRAQISKAAGLKKYTPMTKEQSNIRLTAKSRWHLRPIN